MRVYCIYRNRLRLEIAGEQANFFIALSAKVPVRAQFPTQIRLHNVNVGNKLIESSAVAEIAG